MSDQQAKQHAAKAAFDAKRSAPLPIQTTRLNVQQEFRRLAQRDLSAWLEYHADGVTGRLEHIRADAARLRDAGLTRYQINHGLSPAGVLSEQALRALPAFRAFQALCRKSNISMTVRTSAENIRIDVDFCKPFERPAKAPRP